MDFILLISVIFIAVILFSMDHGVWKIAKELQKMNEQLKQDSDG